MPEARFKVGDDVWVREPERVTECLSITGPIREVKHGADASIRYVLDAYIARRGGGARSILEFAEHQIGGIRLGTPLDQLSGRPGTPGFERFAAIARTWGYD